MVTIVVIAHRPLATAFVEAARHVYSRDPCAASRQLVALDVAPDADVAAALAQAKAFVAAADRGQGVLVLTDLVGATPGNVAAQVARPGEVAVIAGLNMPMLLRALCYGESGLDALVAKAAAGGTAGVQQIAASAANPGAPTCAPEQPPGPAKR